jgi:2-C-methyl-D-erythritol 4-phosphate cytidylyltransferase
MNIALILAGGIGSRAKLEIPKQFYKVNNKPVIVYTLERFQASPSVDKICVVCEEKWEDEVLNYREHYNISKLSSAFRCGNTGLKSLYNGLVGIKCSNDDFILIHDAVRPFVDIKVIEDNINTAQKNGLAMTAVSCVETLVYTTDGCYSEQVIPRDGLKRIQTPQTFRYGDIIDLLTKTNLDTCQEPSAFALWMASGKSIYCSAGNEKNIKITYPEDIDYFTKLFT